MNKKFTSRILSMLLAVLMLISMMPTSVFAAPASDIPAEMLDNVFLDALEYTGYKVQAQRDDGTIFKKYSGGATAYLSKISYGLNKYGTETVAKSGTATGLAPDIAGFESSGLCCASYVSYVYYNYLPNIAGIDTSSATRPYNLRTATAYNAAANAWISAGTARRISFSQNANGNNFIPSEDIPIGSLIIFKHIPTGDIAHVALYTFRYGGADLMMREVRECFKVDVDRYIRVNFATFVQGIESVGGVDISLTEAEAAYINKFNKGGITCVAGQNHLDGRAALEYARCRKIDSDWQRVKRQRNVIQAAVNSTKDLSISELNDLMNQVFPLVQTNLSKLEITELLMLAPKCRGASIQQITIPIKDSYGGMTGLGGRSLFSVDFDTNARALREFMYGENSDS